MAAPTVVSMTLLDNGNWEIQFSDNTTAEVPAVIPTDFTATPPAPNFGSGGGGGGGAVTIADGADVAEGHTTDTSSASTVIGLLKAVKAAVQGTIAVSGTFWQATQPVSGTFWQATQPISVADGANVTQATTTDASSANTLVGLLKAIKAAVQGTVAVSGTFWQATQPVSAADGSQVTIGSKGDAANTATDTTAISVMQVLKQISKTLQAQLTFGYAAAASALPVVTSSTGNSADGLVSIATSSTTLLAARSKRVRAVIKNTDATNPIYLNTTGGTATTSDFPLKAGESVELRSTTAITAIATGSTVSAAYIEEYHT